MTTQSASSVSPSSPQAPGSVVELLQAMVGFDTVNGNISGKHYPEAALLNWLETVARSFGFSTCRIPVPEGGENLLVTLEVDPDAKWIAFQSHLDTVAVDGMTVEPFAAQIRDGKIWGRGTCDTKGTGSSMLWAMRTYASGENRPNNVALIFGADEEYGMTGIKAVAANWPAMGFAPVGVIVGEPTSLQPIIAHNGVVRWRLVTRGVAAHSSQPSEGKSAISAMVKLIEALESRFIPTITATHEMTGSAAASINMVQGGSAFNIIPDYCVASVDRRLVPGETPEDAFDQLKAFVETFVCDTSIDVEIEPVIVAPPLVPDGSRAFIESVCKSLAVSGLSPDPRGVAFATDGGTLSEIGVPTVILGPGGIGQAHTKDEFITIEQLERGVEAYLDLMRSLL